MRLEDVDMKSETLVEARQLLIRAIFLLKKREKDFGLFIPNLHFSEL